MWRAHRFAKSFPRAGAAVQCASSRTSVASQDAHSNLRSLRCGPVWTTLTSHIGSPQEGQRGRSATNTIEVKTQSVRGTASSRSGADGARSAVKRLIHGAGSPDLGYVDGCRDFASGTPSDGRADQNLEKEGMTEVLEKLFWLVLVLNIRHGKALFLALGRPRFFNDLRQVRKNVGLSANQIIADLRSANNGLPDTMSGMSALGGKDNPRLPARATRRGTTTG